MSDICYKYTCTLPEDMNKCPSFEKKGTYCILEETNCGMARKIDTIHVPVSSDKKEKWFDKYYK